jgi:hypothetical protein
MDRGCVMDRLAEPFNDKDCCGCIVVAGRTHAVTKQATAPFQHRCAQARPNALGFAFTWIDSTLGCMAAPRAQLASASRIFTYRLWKSSARSREPGDAASSRLSSNNTVEGSIP